MNLDARVPLGWMFSLAGLVLTFLGFKSSGDPALFVKTLGINANLWWGLVLLVFGLTMFLFGRKRQMQIEKSLSSPPEKDKAHRRR